VSIGRAPCGPFCFGEFCLHFAQAKMLYLGPGMPQPMSAFLNSGRSER